MNNEYYDIIQEVLTEYQDNIGDIDCRECSFQKGLFLLVEDKNTVQKINEMFSKKLLELNHITEKDIKDNMNSIDHFIYFVGIDYGYTDEYIICDICQKIVPIYMTYWYNIVRLEDDDIMCSKCANENPKVYVEEYLLVNPTEHFNDFLSDKDLEALGFKLEYSRLESDKKIEINDIQSIYKQLKQWYRDIIFSDEQMNKIWVRGNLEE